MASLRDIFVRLGIKTDPKGFNQADQKIAKVKESALTLGRVLTTGAIAIGAKLMIETASDIEETANKFGAVFGAASDAVQGRLADIGRRTGATNLTLQQMSSNIGALIKPSLGSAEAAGQMAAQVSELALDISSFNNVSSDDALIAMRAALIGSAEPMQQFGVDTRIAALQQEALRQGITKSYQKMTEGERIALRFAAIQRQLGAQGATGDATRTALGFANASRNLIAALKETAGVIGTFLLRSVGNAVNRIRTVVNTFQTWLRANRELIQQRVDKFIERAGRVLTAVSDLASELADRFTAWRDSLDPVGQQILRITGIVLALVAAMMLPGVPILLLAALIGLLVEDFQTWRKGGESVIGDLVAWFQWLGQEIAAWADSVLTDISAAWQGIKDAVSEAIDGMVAAVMEYVDAVTGTLGALSQWVDEHETGIRYVTSLIAGAALVYAAHWARANQAAIVSFLRMQGKAILSMVRVGAVGAAQAIANGVKWVASAALSAAAWVAQGAIMIGQYIAIGALAVAQAAVTSAAWVASAVAAAAAWLVATGPVLLMGALLAVIVGTVIWLGRELYRLATGQSNFFSTMHEGIAGLIEEWGSVGAAIGAMLDEAVRYWAKFFGASDEQIQSWIDAATDTLDSFWTNVIEGWSEALSRFFGWLGDMVPDFIKNAVGRGEGGEEAAAEGEAVGRAAKGAAQAAAAPPVFGPMAAGSIMSSPTAGAGGRSVVQNQTSNISVNVTPSPGMNERELAELTAAEIQRAREAEMQEAYESYAVEGAY